VKADETGAPDVSEHGGDLGGTLLALGSRLHRIQEEILGSLDPPLTLRQYRILSRVRAGHTSLTALCKLAHRNPSTMSEGVDKLVKMGLLTRGTVEENRRTMRLGLTDAGLIAQQTGRRALEKFTGELTAGIPAELHDLLLPTLITLYHDSQRNLDERATDKEGDDNSQSPQ